VCFKKKDGCGTKFRDGDPSIEGQAVGRTENPDPFDLDVVLAKMSEKRAYIDATLRATAASGLFTQDLEELPREEPSAAPTTERPADATGAEGASALTGPAPVAKAAPRPAFTKGLARTQGNQDYEARQSPDGLVLPFRVGPRIVVAEGDELIRALVENRERILGAEVIARGMEHEESFAKDGEQRFYKVLHLESIEAPDFVFPTPAAATTSPSVAAAPGLEDADAVFAAMDAAERKP
jgi:hypothetical protein